LFLVRPASCKGGLTAETPGAAERHRERIGISPAKARRREGKISQRRKVFTAENAKNAEFGAAEKESEYLPQRREGAKEKFLDPSLLLGMTGLARHLASWRLGESKSGF
jgi:hypothetical protein